MTEVSVFTAGERTLVIRLRFPRSVSEANAEGRGLHSTFADENVVDRANTS